MNQAPGILSRSALDALDHWSKTNAQEFPWRRTTDPYRILVAEMLLRRTTATAVLRVYDDFIRAFPTMSALAEAEVPQVALILRPLGLRHRAKGIRDACREMVHRFGGVPAKYADLKSIKWIGDYTASAVLTLTGREILPLVDEGIIRLVCRFLNDMKLSRRTIVDGIMKSLDARGGRELGLSLLDVSRTVCRPRGPKCDICPLNRHCAWEKKPRVRTN